MRALRASWAYALLVGVCATGLVVRGQPAADPPTPNDAPAHARPTDALELSARQAKLQQTLDAQHAKHQLLETERETLKRRADETQAQLAQRLHWLYRMGRSSALPIGEGLDAVLAHLSRVGRLERMVERDVGAMDAVDAQQQKLVADQQTIDAALNRLHAELEALDQTQQQLAETANRFGRALLPGKAKVPLPDRGVPADAFTGRHGQLALPLSGNFRVREARRQESDGPGIEFLCAAGTPVRSVASGRVAFADHYGSYGRLIIVEHENGYYTVYAGLGAVDVRVGDELGEGARLGVVASEPSPPALFFELRRGTRTLPPRPWFGL